MYRKDSVIIEEWIKSSNKTLLVTDQTERKEPKIGKLIVNLDIKGL